MKHVSLSIIRCGIAAALSALTSAGIASAQAPNGELSGRRSFFEPEGRPQKFQTAANVFPVRPVRAGSNVWKLAASPFASAFRPTYSWKGQTYGLEDYYQRAHLSALLVLKDDKIVLERYLAGSTNHTHFVSFSSAKSFTSILIGLALEDGFIKSIEDPVKDYVPALSGGPYERVTIQHCLQMLSGVPVEAEAKRIDAATQVDQRYRYVEAANSLRPERPIGEKFVYSNMDAALLGWVLENAARKRVATYMEQRLWQPAGMEFDAAWILDGPPEIGREGVAWGLLATLRDCGRFGLIMLHDGSANGHRILSSEWIRAATKPNHPAVGFGRLQKGYPLGYGYLWWIHPNGRFETSGAFGHFVHVAPDANVVIVSISHWPDLWSDEREAECHSFFDGVVAALK